MGKPPKFGLIATYISMPFVLAVPPLVGMYLGYLLDRAFHTEPVLMYVFIVMGIAAGILEFVRIIKRFKE